MMTRKREILNRIQSLLSRTIENVTAIEEYVNELEAIESYENLHGKGALDDILSTDPDEYLKREV